jgi:hypothetical protein
MLWNIQTNLKRIHTLLLLGSSEVAKPQQPSVVHRKKTENVEAVLKKFASLIRIQNECWEWTGRLNQYGYGRMKFQGKRGVRTHRISYMLFCGEIPEGIFVCHHCDNPSCVNPEHLFLGTHDDNNKDKCRKNRQPAGDIHWNRKLTVAQVSEIREDFRILGILPTPEKAKILGISYSYLKQIAQGTERKKSYEPVRVKLIRAS